MAEIVFYEKPGCRNNALQKQMLRAAGHRLDVRSLLTHAWTEDELLPFLRTVPLSDWFNLSAPAITSGVIEPASLCAGDALTAMLKDPLLIRRPLMQSGKIRRVGFDIGEVNSWVGLRPEDVAEVDVERCRRAPDEKVCP